MSDDGKVLQTIAISITEDRPMADSRLPGMTGLSRARVDQITAKLQAEAMIVKVLPSIIPGATNPLPTIDGPGWELLSAGRAAIGLD